MEKDNIIGKSQYIKYNWEKPIYKIQLGKTNLIGKNQSNWEKPIYKIQLEKTNIIGKSLLYRKRRKQKIKSRTRGLFFALLFFFKRQ